MMKSLKSVTSWIPSDRNIQFALLGLGIVLAVAALGGGLYWYRLEREQQAMRAFVDAVSQYENVRADQEGTSQWSDVADAFQYGFDQFHNASIAGYFLAFESEALYQQDQHDAACNTLAKALDYIPRDNTLYYSYALKLALMQIDSVDTNLQQQGHQALENLAQDTDNPLRDMALYYYGLQYFNEPNREAAWTAWQPLLDENNFDQNTAWASRAHAKLAYTE